MKELILFLVKQLIDHAETVSVSENGGLTLKVHPSDLKKVIGREGRVIKAIRCLLNSSSLAMSEDVNLEVKEFEIGS